MILFNLFYLGLDVIYIMKEKILEFLKIYFVFLAIAFVINTLIMEILVAPSVAPEHQKSISEQGWRSFVYNQLVGVTILYSIFSFVGSIIFFKKRFDFKRMGLLSFISGFVLEFTFMRPEWVQAIYELRVSGEVIGAVIVSSLYWFIPWGVPSYILQKYFLKEKD